MLSPNLKTKLTLLAVLPTTLIAGFLGTWMVFSSYSDLRSQAISNQLALARSLADRADEGISQSFSEVLFLAKAPGIVNMDKTIAEQELSLVSNSDALVDSVFVVQRDGHIFAQSQPPADRGTLPARSLFLDNMARVRELSGSESVITDLYLTKRQQPAEAISAPILRGPFFKGTLVAVMHLPTALDEVLESGDLGRNAAAIMVNEDGVILSHPDPSRVFADFSKNPAVAAALKEKDGTIEYRRANDNTPMLASFARVESATWSVIITQPRDDAYAPAQRMLPVLILYLVVTLLMVALIAGALARRVASPILDLTDKVLAQDLKQLAGFKAPEGGDEVGLLTNAVSRLAEDLSTEREESERAHRRALSAERRLSERERLASIGQLAAGLAHELNNPLTVIQGAAEVAEGERGQKLKVWLQAILKETRRCKNLVRDLLDFARPLKLRLRRSDVYNVVREAWVQSSMGREETAKIVLPGRGVKLKIDPERLKQVFINLFSNAREAGGDGGHGPLGGDASGLEP